MSLLYKILMFLWLFYLISMFVFVLNVFPYTPFSDIKADHAYKLITDRANLNSATVIDYFYHFDSGLPGINKITSLGIIAIFISIGLITSIYKSDIRPLVVAFTFGAILAMLRFSITFMTRIVMVTSGGGSAAIVLLGIFGAAIFFILGITVVEKYLGSDDIRD